MCPPELRIAKAAIERIVLFVLNRPPLIEAYKKRGGVLAQYAVSDASLSVMKTFRPRTARSSMRSTPIASWCRN